MLKHILAATASLTLLATPHTFATEASSYEIAQPINHKNLTIYLLRGDSAPGPVPLTLQEAMANGTVKVFETGDVNTLSIQNTGKHDVFVQAGDIVKGGRQDRVLAVSLILPPEGEPMPIDAFCVEQGRWSARDGEDVVEFASSEQALPSRDAKLAMKGTTSQRDRAAQNEQAQFGYSAQGAVWSEVAKVQANLSDRLNETVTDDKSPTSLQLALENQSLNTSLEDYTTHLLSHTALTTGTVGYVAVINGEIVSADIYPSHGLFRKMWEKNVTAAATEALGTSENMVETVSISNDDIRTFIDEGTAEASTQYLSNSVSLIVANTETRLDERTVSTDGQMVHRSILAK